MQKKSVKKTIVKVRVEVSAWYSSRSYFWTFFYYATHPPPLIGTHWYLSVIFYICGYLVIMKKGNSNRWSSTHWSPISNSWSFMNNTLVINEQLTMTNEQLYMMTNTLVIMYNCSFSVHFNCSPPLCTSTLHLKCALPLWTSTVHLHC